MGSRPSPGGRGRRGGGGDGVLARVARHREGEGEGRALARAGALGPDAPAMRLHQPLADGEAEAGPAGSAAGPARAGVLLEQPRQQLRRHAPALVGDRDRDMRAVAHRRDPDGRGFGRVPGGVGEEVVQHLHDALAVGHHRRKPGRQVDEHGVPGAAREEGVARLVDERRHLRRLGLDRERARVDAPRVEQVGDEADHVIGLPVDDAEELAHLDRAEHPPGAEHRGGRALDGGQRRAQLVAHQAEELRAQALELLERREVLQGDHHRDHRAVLAVDRASR